MGEQQDHLFLIQINIKFAILILLFLQKKLYMILINYIEI